MSSVEGFLAHVAEWALDEPDVRAALLVGSQARSELPADEWSDVDVALFVDDPPRLAGDVAWVSAFGTPELTFVEGTAVGGELERRVLYADGLEVDFALFPTAAAAALLADPRAATVPARGYRVLHDEVGLAEALAQAGEAAPDPRPDPRELVADFWYHVLWAAKKLRRGEAVNARNTLEGRLKRLLLELAREHARRRNPSVDTWHADRFAERWADPRAVAAIWHVTASGPEELPAAFRRLCDVFDELAAELLQPDPGAAAARARLAVLLPER